MGFHSLFLFCSCIAPEGFAIFFGKIAMFTAGDMEYHKNIK